MHAIKVATILASLAIVSASQAQTPPPGPNGPPAPEPGGDAQAYSTAFSVAIGEAERRLKLQASAGALEAQLAGSSGFGGLFIDHAPNFRVVVRAVGAGEGLRPIIAASDLADLVTVEPAAMSLSGLMDLQTTTLAAVTALGVDAEAGLDVRTGRVKLYVVDLSTVRARLTPLNLDPVVDLVAAPRLSRTEADLVGGRALYDAAGYCTSGFVVRTSANVRGVLTAGHCPQALFYEGVAATFQTQNDAGAFDVQWHTVASSPPKNQVYVGTATNLTITSATAQASQAVGAYVCKYGWASGYTCGLIADKAHTFRSSATFVRVDDNATRDMSAPGDSGAPWFSNNAAYGVHTGSADSVDPNDAFYMGIDRISTLGVSVLTAP